MKTTQRHSRWAALLAALLVSGALGQAQVAPDPKKPAANAPDEDIVVLSPFEVTASATESYNAATTLAGNRLNTDLRDVGSSVTVYTSQFFKDLGATNNNSLLQYTISSEVGGIYGNFSGVGGSSTYNEASNLLRPSKTTEWQLRTACPKFFLCIPPPKKRGICKSPRKG